METFIMVTVAVMLAASSSAAPQYNYNQPTAGSYGAGTCSSCGNAGSSSELSTSGASYDQSYQQAPGSGFGSGQGSGGGRGGLNTECRAQPNGEGRIKFICEPIPGDALTLRSEHILWLTSGPGGSQIYDIEVPNYKIEELIKAGFKGGAGGDTKINVLLKKPEQTADAEIDVPKGTSGSASVSLQYEPVQPQKIHFPNDKQYRPLSGPILPPLAGDRGRRQIIGPNGQKYIQ